MSATQGINDNKNLWNVRGFLHSFTLNCLNKLMVCRKLVDESYNSPIFLPLSWSGTTALPHITYLSRKCQSEQQSKELGHSLCCTWGWLIVSTAAVCFVFFQLLNSWQAKMWKTTPRVVSTVSECNYYTQIVWALNPCVNIKPFCNTLIHRASVKLLQPWFFYYIKSFCVSFVKLKQNISYCCSLRRFLM